MTRSDDLFGDMPTLPPTFESAREDDLLVALMTGAALPPEAPVEARLVADLFSALSAPGTDEETAGLEAARLAFRTERPVASPGPRRLARRTAAGVTRSRPSGRLVAASIIGVLGLGGFAGAAFAGVLPDAMQTVAHRLVGAPSPDNPHATHTAGHHSSAPGSTPATAGRTTGPDATGAAAFGLCTAYDRSRTDHAAQRSAYEHSRAYQQLVLAAGGRENVAAYCASVPHPSASAPGASHAQGKPSGSGHSGTGHSAATGRPSDAPSHPAHPTRPASSAAPSSDVPTSASSAVPVAPPHPTHTKSPSRGAHTTPARATRSPR